VVDFESGLVKTDLLLESFIALIKQRPRRFFSLPLWLLKGRAYFKQQVARLVSLDVDVLPYHVELLGYLKSRRSEGCPVILSTDGDMRHAQQVADHLNVFDSVMASDSLTSEFGEEGFERVEPGREAIGKKNLVDRLKPLRLQHWLKNLLVFVPLLAAHRIAEDDFLLKLVLAFFAFGCFASSGYMMNDLFDLAADRHHPAKRLRPFAAGDLPLSYAFAMIPLLIGIGCLTGLLVSRLFLATAATYLALSVTYSLWFKRIVLLDVVVLAGLYTLRILAGSAAVTIWPSHWLLAFSTFLFFSLALVKRYGELAVMKRIEGDHAKAREYELTDAELLSAMGVASGYLAVLVLALYINSEKAHSLYGQYELMWFLCPLLLYWISRVWLIAHRGRMPDDPVVFAAQDRTSRLLFLLMLIISVLAVGFGSST